MSSFRKTKLKVKRRPPGEYDSSGFFKISGVEEEFDIYCSVQPVSGSEMLLLPENKREKEIIKLYTSTELYSVEKGNPINSDLVIIGGDEYEVFKVIAWNNNIISHYKIFVSKRTTNDNIPTN